MSFTTEVNAHYATMSRVFRVNKVHGTFKFETEARVI